MTESFSLEIQQIEIWRIESKTFELGLNLTEFRGSKVVVVRLFHFHQYVVDGIESDLAE